MANIFNLPARSATQDRPTFMSPFPHHDTVQVNITRVLKVLCCRCFVVVVFLLCTLKHLHDIANEDGNIRAWSSSSESGCKVGLSENSVFSKQTVHNALDFTHINYTLLDATTDGLGCNRVTRVAHGIIILHMYK